ncbi:MAG: glycosyltransferase [Aurantimicrobium sp.]|nr:glycosyltransferase [Aurantimicrobium sp.]
MDTYYPAVIKSLGFHEHHQLKSGFESHIRELTSAGFGTGAAYSSAMNGLGWDSNITVPNARGIQTVWAHESGLATPIQQGWNHSLHLSRIPVVRSMARYFPHVHQTLLNQVKRTKPDVLFIQDLNLIPRSFARELKKHAGMMVGEIASPPPPKSYFLEYDLIVSALPSIVSQVESWGVNSVYIPLAFDERWASFKSTSSRKIDAIFIGSFSRHQPQTIPLLQSIASVAPGLHIFGPANLEDLDRAGLRSFYHGEAWGQDMFNLLANSKIVVNRHGTIAGDFAVNMRMYEATGSGAALVTENKSNLSEIFEPGREVIAYNNYDEAAASVLELLQDESRLSEVARNGQSRTLREHTYTMRASVLSSLLGGP